MSIAAHRDFQGHADDSLPGQADKPVEPTLTGPGVCDSLAISPAERRDDFAQLQQRSLLQMELW